jgi:hypothetical protein
MPKRTIYFDECSFMGNHLLDRNQPIFTIASAAIEDRLA